MYVFFNPISVCSRHLWRSVDLSHLDSVTPGTLKWLLRRAPESLKLPNDTSYRQMVWLLSRSPMLRKLTMKGASWSTVSAINTGQAPPLRSLNLAWSDISDSQGYFVQVKLSVHKNCHEEKNLRYLSNIQVSGGDNWQFKICSFRMHSGQHFNFWTIHINKILGQN